jgi:hypothetical protein
VSDANNNPDFPPLPDVSDVPAAAADQPSPHLIAESVMHERALPGEPAISVGEVKKMLSSFAHARAAASVADLPTDLRAVYDLLCAQAATHGVDPVRALRRESLYAESHRPQLVRGATPDKD